MIASDMTTLIDPVANDVCLSQGVGAPLDTTALRVARLQMAGVFIYPYAPGRWRVVRLENAAPRIVGSGESLMEALDEAEDVVRGYRGPTPSPSWQGLNLPST
jgi:hypothetical protein